MSPGDTCLLVDHWEISEEASPHISQVQPTRMSGANEETTEKVKAFYDRTEQGSHRVILYYM